MPGSDAASVKIERLEAEVAHLRDRLESAESYTAQTLLRATRLAQVISVLGHDAHLETLVERTSVEIAELFSADIAVLMLGPDDAVTVAGQWGLRPGHHPDGPFALPPLEGLTAAEPVLIGPADEVAMPEWLEQYGGRHAAWARLTVGDETLGVMLLVRRAPVAFARSDEKELRAIAYRIAMAIENGLLQQRTQNQLEQMHRLQLLTTDLAGTLELEAVGARVAEMLVAEVPVSASVVSIRRGGRLVILSRAHDDVPAAEGPWTRFPLEAAGTPVGTVDVAAAPVPGSEAFELMMQVVGLAALALDKALLYEQSREQARHDSLTGLLGHRVFQEVLERGVDAAETFSVVLVDIDDFKQINDLHGHQAGDDTLRRVADVLRKSMRGDDSVFRVGGEEFCAVLPGLGRADAFEVAERLRTAVAGIVSGLPVTISLGVASFPADGQARDELLAQADTALYSSKRHGKNRTTLAGARDEDVARSGDRHAPLAMLRDKDADTATHSLWVAPLAVDIARALGVADDRLCDLRTAAQLHDIGKIGVPDAILSKPGPLDADEFRVVKTHPLIGAELLLAWGLSGPARFVLEHHERVDGTGYPSGLRGREIALESRIIHVADAFVAMTLDRPYRRAMSHQQALAELLRHRGTQFDADAVDALAALQRPVAATA
jgi:diguanylate cyclase (GGDEF)-like protein